MFFKYHKLTKKDEIDSWNQLQKDDLIDIVKLIVERPIYSFFSYQAKGFEDDINTFFEDVKWIEKYEMMICHFQEWRIQRVFEWAVGFPCLIYFGIFRFFVCLFRWRKYYRESSLILLKLS